MPSQPSQIAVTLICAAEHQAALAGLIHRLELAGMPPRVLFDGVREPERVLETLAEVGPRGLFVICEGSQVDELGFRRIEGVIRKQGGRSHRLIRLDLSSRSPMVLVTRIVRECEALAELDDQLANQLANQTKPEPARLAPVDEQAGISLPAIRLEPGEQLDGDTLRIDLPDSPKLAELARRRKALRERDHGPARLPGNEVGSSRVDGLLEPPPGGLDRKALVLLVGAALLAVLIALIVSGTLG